MKRIVFFSIVALAGWCSQGYAAKRLDDNAKANQSEVFQKAIDDLAAKGGGRLIVPTGTYQLAGVKLKSNVHLLFEKDTVIKPYWPEGTKTVVFNLDAERPANKRKMTPEQERAYIENVSLRGLGGCSIIDYSDRERSKGEGIRGVLAKMVKNFLIADLDLKDNFSAYCGITLTPMQTKNETKDWPVSRATEGHYHIAVENVTLEGFKYNADKPILTEADFRGGK